MSTTTLFGGGETPPPGGNDSCAGDDGRFPMIFAKTDAELLGETFDGRDHYKEVWLAGRALDIKPARWPKKLSDVHGYKGVIKLEGRMDNDTPEETSDDASVARWMKKFLAHRIDEDGNVVPAKYLRRADVLDRLRMIDLYCQIVESKRRRIQ